ncbi:hypothetical protein PR003_g21481 [Phytophthora rubi]|uniref:Uncharacterized protein n=1 Tax=Phytophthora rubi TaxID=129364 RepID=A0A6A4DBN7_9STRA|nr:hypothetical protein PR002_g16093 [Phytophthora rubi]KAE9022358.1 hypothetical protein PR001_g13160 [Phytophthora rubi]KAE9305496.1 hypothetical protein PR003_g21481 [Phytophthora rubi]
MYILFFAAGMSVAWSQSLIANSACVVVCYTIITIASTDKIILVAKCCCLPH